MFKKIVTVLILALLITSCGSRKRSARTVSTKLPESKERVKVTPTKKEVEKPKEVVVKPRKIVSTEDYISVYKDIAISEMKQYGIPASITLAQGILESGSGRGTLAVKANNHFGIKCHGWEGGKIYHDDDEKGECFRKYKSPNESFRDHSEFLVNRQRYAKLFQLRKDNYKGWARELRKAGYATDRKYPEKLIALIERYNLDKYDEKEKSKRPKKKQSKVAIATYTVVKGDTLYSISRKYNLTVKELQQLNGLSNTELSVGQVLNIQIKDK